MVLFQVQKTFTACIEIRPLPMDRTLRWLNTCSIYTWSYPISEITGNYIKLLN